MRTHSLNALAIIFCLLALSAAPALGSGQPEAGLKQVQALIASKDFMAAQKLLVEIRRKNPDLIDPTQDYLDLIMAHERTYNTSRRELRDALERKDVEAADGLIAKLEEMDPHKALLVEKREARNLRASRDVDGFMDSVAVLLSQRRYSEAITAYLLPFDDPSQAGFATLRDQFLASRETGIYVASVQSASAAIRAAAAKATSLDRDARAVAPALEALLSGDGTERTVGEFSRAAAPLRALSSTEADVRRFTDSLAAVNLAVAGSMLGGREDEYVAYLVALCRGRAGKAEGIATAIRLLWEATARAAAETAVRLASASFDASLRSFDAAVKSGNAAGLGFADASFQSASYKNLAAVEAGKLIQSAGWTFTAENRDILNALRAQAIASQESADESVAFRSLISFQVAAAGLPAPDKASTQSRKSAQDLAARVDAQQVDWRTRSGRWSAQSGTGMDIAALSKAARQMSERFAALAEELRSRDVAYAVRLAGAESYGFAPRLDAAVAGRLRGEDFLNGTRGGRPPADPNELVPRVPASALDAFTASASDLEGVSKAIGAWKTKWAGDLPSIARSEGLAVLLSAADALAMRTAQQALEIAALKTRAEDNVFNAEKSRRDAEEAFAEAGKSLARKEYDQARALAGDDAAGLYLASLALEENAQSRTRLEKDIPALLTRIEQAIYEKSVKEVDTLIDQAVVRFKATQYLDARIALDRARDLWEQMPEGKTRKYETLEYWYGLVLNALGVSAGRNLASNDPRLDVVSPLMSRARELYAEAEKLAADADKLRKTDPKSAKIADMLGRKGALLGQAGGYVASVLGVVNGSWEAKVLQLKIRKLNDETTFGKDASEGVKAVLAGLASTPRTIKASDAYFELKEYQGLVADRALTSTIERTLSGLEDELNLKVKTLSREQLAQAAAVVSEAKNRFKPEDKETYSGTLALLDQVLAIDSNNAAARALRQEVLIKMGSPAVGVLNREDQRIFTEAQTLLNSGGELNERQSWDMIQPLLPKYATFQPLKKLEATLKARLRL
ncbi:MAG: hypothetical protein NT005_12885 [Spirochaetes bacterium]|nr:hypothetical protein [Spirochaetota bacterium]